MRKLEKNKYSRVFEWHKMHLINSGGIFTLKSITLTLLKKVKVVEVRSMDYYQIHQSHTVPHQFPRRHWIKQRIQLQKGLLCHEKTWDILFLSHPAVAREIKYLVFSRNIKWIFLQLNKQLFYRLFYVYSNVEVHVIYIDFTSFHHQWNWVFSSQTSTRPPEGGGRCIWPTLCCLEVSAYI
jgi:hypothetical protein